MKNNTELHVLLFFKYSSFPELVIFLLLLPYFMSMASDELPFLDYMKVSTNLFYIFRQFTLKYTTLTHFSACGMKIKFPSYNQSWDKRALLLFRKFYC